MVKQMLEKKRDKHQKIESKQEISNYISEEAIRRLEEDVYQQGNFHKYYSTHSGCLTVILFYINLNI